MSDVSQPSWASFLDAHAWSELVRLVDEAFARRSLPATWRADEGGVELVHPERGTITFGLVNLAQMMHQLPQPAEWRRMVGHHVRVFLAAADDTSPPEPSEFAGIKDQLRIRLYPTSAVDPSVPIVGMPVMPGVVAALARDLPDSVVTVPKDDARAWGLEDRDLLALALHNTVQEDCGSETVTLDDGVKVIAWSGQSFFVASRVLALERWLDVKAGALVVIPNRHLAIFHPIVDDHAIQAMDDLWAMAQQPFREGPGSITPDLFWWTPGRFMKIPVTVDEAQESMSVEPPAELIEVLKTVMGDELDA